MLTLYFAPGASSMAAHIALFEVGARFEGRPLSFARHENRTRDYLAINPLGQVPTLVVEGRALTEVAGILFYLAKTYPKTGLLPDDAEGQARVVSWMSFLASTVHPARRQGLDHARKIYAQADRRLGPHDWAVGGRYSIADIHLFRLFWRFLGSLNPPAEEFPNLMALHARMLERPAVQQTLQVEAAAGYELPSQGGPERAQP
ncbi:MAG TPA: glutathione S-transferase family protein [Phenylobacterium sp.]|jgi:glutathione S-transferase|uniref:glutathione S-transferase family protein n=1 Tax=Phenylobacterium sp. TaxID=1871053 RepID=UPI002D22C7DF|nr:glutathione S-transferase family protein [Phenylobacterium sp.]HZZ67584.1 glutathione S-transferase family protein [Phenylobacterium sp.]